ncbi:MAG: hypothetical protein FWD49_05765 [Firmicutes bacterium]|nr:hypothetical protein [Bacillota bacterium]
MLLKTFVIEIKDKRDIYLFESLAEDGRDVAVFGDLGNLGAGRLSYIMNVTTVITPSIIAMLEEGSELFSRSLSEEVKELALKKNILHTNYFDNEEFVYKNAYLTAEGTLAHIITNTDSSIVGLKTLILGYGKVGKALAKVLKDNYAFVAVANRIGAKLDEAVLFADKTFKLSELKSEIGNYAVVVNTIPHLVLTKDLLKQLNSECFVIDLASLPGGVDTNAVKELNIKLLHALGIPGKVAPKSASEYIKAVITQTPNG